jgi:hypothetical protein
MLISSQELLMSDLALPPKQHVPNTAVCASSKLSHKRVCRRMVSVQKGLNSCRYPIYF